MRVEKIGCMDLAGVLVAVLDKGFAPLIRILDSGTEEFLIKPVCVFLRWLDWFASSFTKRFERVIYPRIARTGLTLKVLIDKMYPAVVVYDKPEDISIAKIFKYGILSGLVFAGSILLMIIAAASIGKGMAMLKAILVIAVTAMFFSLKTIYGTKNHVASITYFCVTVVAVSLIFGEVLFLMYFDVFDHLAKSLGFIIIVVLIMEFPIFMRPLNVWLVFYLTNKKISLFVWHQGFLFGVAVAVLAIFVVRLYL